MVLRSPVPLNPPPRCLGEWLAEWARRTPERTFLAERDGHGAWRHLIYGAAHRAARAVGQGLLDRGLGPERPLLILSENSIEHALMMLGALQAGVPVAPVSIAYARLSQDFRKLRYIADLVAPGLLYVSDGARYGAALGALDLTAIEIVAGANPPRRRGVTEFSELLATEPGAGIDAAYAATRSGHGGEDPLHLGLHRRAQGRHQHPPHALLQPGGAGADLAVPHRAAAGAGGLAAVEPHFRRQPRHQPGAAQRRHALYRRRQAAARA